MDGFRVASLNVNGAREVRKRALVLDTARSKRIDVLFLQEVHSDQSIEGDWEKEWEGQVALSHNTTLSGGVGILFSRRFTPSSLEVEPVVQGRCLLVRAKFDTYTLVLVNIYAPNNGPERKRFFETVNSKLNCCGPEDFLFLGGDFNCTEAEFLDRNHAEPHPVSQHSWSTPTAWFLCGGGCMQTAVSTPGPT